MYGTYDIYDLDDFDAALTCYEELADVVRS